jgi:hypothetical protein
MGSVEYTHPTNPYSTGKTDPLWYQAKASYPSLTKSEEISHKIQHFFPETFEKRASLRIFKVCL